MTVWNGLRKYLFQPGLNCREVLAALGFALIILVPGLSRYSLVDPWETHYAEVARRMLQDNDFVDLSWSDENFHSKPVLTFWLIATGLRVFGLAEDGGYSGEMVSTPLVMFAARLPFALIGVLGALMLFALMSRLISRGLGWLTLLVLLTTPFYSLVARQAITDIPMVVGLIGALTCFCFAICLGDQKLPRLRWNITSYHIFLGVIGTFTLGQLIYYAHYFYQDPNLAPGVRFPQPAFGVPGLLAAMLGIFLFWTPVFRYGMFGFVTVGGMAIMIQVGALVAVTSGFPVAAGIAGGIVSCALPLLVLYQYTGLAPQVGIWPSLWRRTTTRRQLFMYWFFAFIAMSVLAKGVPAIGITGAVCFFYFALTGRWDLLRELEIPRGIWLVALITVPWHLAIWLREGAPWFQEYILAHNFDRATAGMHGDRGTFAFFTSQIGIGVWPWAGLVPLAVARGMNRPHECSPNHPSQVVALVLGLLTVVAMATFSLVQTKFHHYILPIVPALAALVAFVLWEIWRKPRPMGVFAVLGAAITLLLMRDLIAEPKQFIEMFVYRYDRPWPHAPPWQVDVTGPLLGFGSALACGYLLLAWVPLQRIGVITLGVAALGCSTWVLHCYMKSAGTHWGMRDAVRAYYDNRNIQGIDFGYYGLRQLADHWNDRNNRFVIESHVPTTLAAGDSMKVSVTVHNHRSGKIQERFELAGKVKSMGTGQFQVEIRPEERMKLAGAIKRGLDQPRALVQPYKLIKADRLISWKLYWRGENFWTADEIWGPTPDTRTDFKRNSSSKVLLDYLSGPGREGRRYFLITEAGSARGTRAVLPTERAKHSFRIVDTTSNKFTLVSFRL